MSVLPEFDVDGNLPPGLHRTNWQEIESRFGLNEHRRRQLSGLRRALESLRRAGCRVVYLDGSFVSCKEFPNDYDACWDLGGVDPSRLDPVLLDFTNHRQRQKAKYRGELFPAQFSASVSGKAFLDFFQVDSGTGNPKGIVAIDLGSLGP